MRDSKIRSRGETPNLLPKMCKINYEIQQNEEWSGGEGGESRGQLERECKRFREQSEMEERGRGSGGKGQGAYESSTGKI